MSGELHRIFCDNVRERRLQLALTQQLLADRLGLHRVRVTEIESGRSVPTLDLVERVAEALETTADRLLKKIRPLRKTG